jgi:hypothetical protein
MWDDEYEIYLRDMRNILAERNIIEHEVTGVTMNEVRLDDEKLVELKKKDKIPSFYDSCCVNL